jgi:glyoxylase-like metal-dependent hydrolase (beta-lactamase superfamily II)
MITGPWLLLLYLSASTADGEGLRSYHRARDVLDAAVRAIGGLDALRASDTVRRRLSGGWTDVGQGPRPHHVAGPTLEAPPAHFRDEVVTLVDYARGRSVEVLDESNHLGDRIVQVDVVTTDYAFRSTTYFDEKPLLLSFGPEELPSLRARALRRHPEGLLRMALDRPQTLGWAGSGVEFGHPHQVISFCDPVGTLVRLYVDETTHLLTKAETLRAHPVAGDTSTEVVFLDHRPAGRLRLPHRYVDRVAGIPTQVMEVSLIELDVEPEEERFRAPREVARVEPDPPEPAVEVLGDGLYLIRGPYNSVFADLGGEVAVFEASRDSGYAERCLDLVRRTLPGRPVRWLVATHFHHDHLAGIRPYVAEGVTILTTPDARDVIAQVASRRGTMQADAQILRPQAPVIETVSGRRVLGQGRRRVEIHDFGPTEHAAQILVAWFPGEGVLFQADLLDVGSKDLVLAGPDTVRMAERIRTLGLDVRRIVPVHGWPAPRETLDRALAVRARHVR